MEFASALIVTLNDLVVCLLPLIFFRRDGRPTPMWLITALPYAVAPAITWSVFAHWLPQPLAYVPELAFAGVTLSALSIFMIGLTIGAHRVPLALWHQKAELEVPHQIVDWGIYRRVRHPFYSAFIVLMLANALIAQHPYAVLLLLYVVAILSLTARKEEHRLSSQSGEMGSHYRAYMQRTARFFPLPRSKPGVAS